MRSAQTSFDLAEIWIGNIRELSQLSKRHLCLTPLLTQVAAESFDGLLHAQLGHTSIVLAIVSKCKQNGLRLGSHEGYRCRSEAS